MEILKTENEKINENLKTCVISLKPNTSVMRYLYFYATDGL